MIVMVNAGGGAANESGGDANVCAVEERGRGGPVGGCQKERAQGEDPTPSQRVKLIGYLFKSSYGSLTHVA